MKKRRGQKRYFSLMFVPDRERDPQSISLSYAKGRLLFIAVGIICIHLIVGLVGYFQIYRQNKVLQRYRSENDMLAARNQKIESIYKEFLEIKAIDDKIRKAFGSTLGLKEQGDEMSLFEFGVSSQHQKFLAEPQINSELSETSPHILKNGLYFLTESRHSFFDPDYVPTQLPVDGYLTAHFQKGGWFLGRRHYGIDIAAALGTSIKAAGSGTVILADWTPDYGHMVIISHGNGLYSYYGHAMRLLVEQGNSVRKGDPIAFLGNSGISSAPHLHFEIWKDNEPQDPEMFLFTAQRDQK